MYLRYAINLELDDLRAAHARAKEAMLSAIRDETGVKLDLHAFTIGFARRATSYKRAALLMSDPARLRKIVRQVGPLQIVYGGKAHPRDGGGKENIKEIFKAAEEISDAVKLVYVPNYDWHWGALITSGVDLWLNTPIKTREASGTSGMKCALNGVPSLSTLDGWWIEGHLEGLTGWAIEDQDGAEAEEIASLYDKLEKVIMPLFYKDPDGYARVMRAAMSLNGSFFNTQRMLLQYLFNAYTPKSLP
jgi:starch phosphorylase